MRDYWEKAKIGDYCKVGDGAHASLDREDEGIVYLTSKNFKDGGLDLSKVDYISEETYEQYFRSDSRALTQPQKDDVIFSIIGTIGEPYVVKRGEKFGLSSAVSILRPDKEKLLPKYLYYWIRGHYFQDAIYSIKGGVAQSYISQEMIRSLPLYVPPISEQSRIVSILSAFDDLIENNSRRIEILEEMARRIYGEWFVHFRYPGHENDELVDSDTELGEIPQGWEVKSVIDLYDTSAGGTPSRKKDEYFDGSIPWVKTKELNDSFIQDTEETITKLGLDNSSAKLFPESSVLVAMYGATVGQLGILDMDATTNQACCAVIEKEEPFDYSYIFFSLLEYRNKLIGLKQGAAQQNINQGIIKEFKIFKPPISILEEFQDKIYPLLDQIRVLKKKNDKLKETRDLLLPKLILGKIKVEMLTV